MTDGADRVRRLAERARQSWRAPQRTGSTLCAATKGWIAPTDSSTGSSEGSARRTTCPTTRPSSCGGSSWSSTGSSAGGAYPRRCSSAGLRDAPRALGETPTAGEVLESKSFLSTTIHRDVAMREFTAPPGSGGAALLEIEVPAGTPALWVPPLGDPVLRYQGELVLPRGTELRIRGHREDAGISSWTARW